MLLAMKLRLVEFMVMVIERKNKRYRVAEMGKFIYRGANQKRVLRGRL